MSFEKAKERINVVINSVQQLSQLVGNETKEQILQTPSGISFHPGLGMVSESESLIQRADDLRKGSFRILVMGEFKNGKSTTLNAMLGEDLLPAKVTPATSVITFIVQGDRKTVRVHERIGDEIKVREIDLIAFKNEFTITKDDQVTLRSKNKLDRFANVQFVEMESNYPLVQNSVALIDSPGLAERESRTKVTRNYLSRVEAIILVLRADQILSEDERAFIASLGSNRLERVFILVNRINLIPANEINDLKDFVCEGLQEYYCKPGTNEFDPELYKRRIFFINALGALDARMGKIVDAAEAKKVLTDSELPHFEEELERFLTSEERIRAVLASSLYVTAGIAQRSKSEITANHAAMSNNLKELLTRQSQTEGELQKLEEDLSDMARQIKQYARIASRRVYDSLKNMIHDLPSTWEYDSQKQINLNDAIKIFELTKGIFSEDAKEGVNKAIQLEIEKYLDLKFGQWSNQAATIIEKTMLEMAEDIKVQLLDFESKLNGIVSYFAGTKQINGLGQSEDGQAKVVKLGLLATYALFVPGGWHDAGMMAGLLWNRMDFRMILRRVLEQVAVIVGVLVVGAFFGGPPAWAALVAAQLLRARSAVDETKKKIRVRIGEEIFKTLQKEVADLEKDVEMEVNKTFDQASSEIINSLRSEIERVRTNQNNIIEKVNGTKQDLEKEKERLQCVGESIEHQISEISQVVYQRSMTVDDLLSQQQQFAE